MGGGSYDRDVYSESSSSGWGSSYNGFGISQVSAMKMGRRNNMDQSLNPVNKVIVSHSRHPIIVVLDVTGSNIDFARVVYDKMPMFYGQIDQQGYLNDFDICFCAVGDAYTDYYPVQIGSFAKGIELDSWLEKIVLEGSGGGQEKESYELVAYYLYKNAKFNPESEPIIFFIGDEAPYSTVNVQQARDYGMECEEEGIEPFQLLREKVQDNVFMLLNRYCGEKFLEKITKSWVERLAPEHVIKIKEEKSIVDLMLGIISMLSKSRSLEEYQVDMEKRGQTKERVTHVTKSLSGLSSVLTPIEVIGSIENIHGEKKEAKKGTRI